MKKLIISPHVDDEILGCGGIIDKDTTILYCGHDESLITNSWVKERPSKDDRLKELDKVQKYLGFSWTMLNNTVNHYNVQNLIENPFDNQGLDDIKTDIYNKLNREIG